MASEHPVKSILQQAIQGEEDSYALYTNLARVTRDPTTRGILQDMAQQEVGHKQRLQEMLSGDPTLIVAAGHEGKIVDLKIGDYLRAEPLQENADFQDVLIVASHREKASHDLYAAMAELACGDPERRLFQYLAEEELAHKNRVEAIYEQTIYKEF